MQTAVEWLVKIYLQTNKIDSFDIKQAKEMEKQQIIDAFKYGVTEGTLTNINYLKCESEADHYYNETYGSKGSYVAKRLKEKMPKHIADMVDAYAEKITNLEKFIIDEQLKEKCCTPEGQIKRYVDCIGCDKKPSSTEISDEEIKDYAIKCRINHELDISVGSFELGAKWYREQLKQRQNG